MVPSSGTKTVNFAKYIELLRSKDLAALEEQRWVFEGLPKFLDGDLIPMKVCFASHPRSGNTFLRKYIESITGIVTGSDISIERYLTFSL